MVCKFAKLRLCLAWPKFQLILPLFVCFLFLYFDDIRGQIEKRIKKKKGKLNIYKRLVFFFFFFVCRICESRLLKKMVIPIFSNLPQNSNTSRVARASPAPTFCHPLNFLDIIFIYFIFPTIWKLELLTNLYKYYSQHIQVYSTFIKTHYLLNKHIIFFISYISKNELGEWIYESLSVFTVQ